MLNKISLALMDETGTVIPVKEKAFQIEHKLDMTLLDLYGEIMNRFRAEQDAEFKFAEKFALVNLLNEFLKENAENAPFAAQTSEEEKENENHADPF